MAALGGPPHSLSLPHLSLLFLLRSPRSCDRRYCSHAVKPSIFPLSLPQNCKLVSPHIPLVMESPGPLRDNYISVCGWCRIRKGRFREHSSQSGTSSSDRLEQTAERKEAISDTQPSRECLTRLVKTPLPA